MKIPDKWWTTPTESHSGARMIITGRDGLQPFIDKGKYTVRIDVRYDYPALPDGFPDESAAQLIGDITDALIAEFDRDGIAILTGIYTGDGIRDWVFYTKNLKVFGIVFNRALAPFPPLSLTFEATEDADWEEYSEMRNLTFIPEAD